MIFITVSVSCTLTKAPEANEWLQGWLSQLVAGPTPCYCAQHLTLNLKCSRNFQSACIAEVCIFVVDVYVSKTLGLSASGFMPLAGRKEKDTL